MTDHTEQIILLPDQNGCFALGKKIASFLKPKDIVLLSGDLGAGKTTLCRSIIRSLVGNSAQEVTSPTFTIRQEYEYPNGLIHHYDLYRLNKPSEIIELGWEESLQNAVTLVEWSEKLAEYKPIDAKEIQIFFVTGKEMARKVVVKNFDAIKPKEQ